MRRSRCCAGLPRRRHRGRRAAAAQSRRLTEADLVEIARTKGQAHLLAMAAAPASAKPSPTCSCAAATARWSRSVADNHRRAPVGRQLRHARAAAPITTVCWPRRSAGVPIFRRGCFATCWSGDRGRAAAAARDGQGGDAGGDPALAREGVERSRHDAQRRATTARRCAACAPCARRASLTRASWSSSPRPASRGDRCGAGGAVQRADRGGRAPDGRRRPDPVLILCKAAVSAGRPWRRSSGAARRARERRARRSMSRLSPTSSGWRRRPRSACCASGRRAPEPRQARAG